ncbi:MAG: hypothetical protein ACFHVJ_08160 [Aestuariibacter sp.]
MMTKETFKTLLGACLLMVIFSALLNGLLLNLLLHSSHLIQVEQLSAKLFDLVVILVLSLIVLKCVVSPSATMSDTIIK